MVFQIPSLCKVVWKRTQCLKIIEKSHLTLRAKRAKFTFRVSRQKWANLASFRKTEACGQTVLPDSSLLLGKKLLKGAKINKKN